MHQIFCNNCLSFVEDITKTISVFFVCFAVYLIFIIIIIIILYYAYIQQFTFLDHG